MSVSLIRTASTMPPKYPDAMPIQVPIKDTRMIIRNVREKEFLAPHRTRENTSLPTLSVPIQ